MTLKINFSSITMSVINMSDMVHFYNNMLDTNMSPFEAYGATFYRGDLAGLKIVFCPVSVSGIVADHNRHQLNFDTSNIAEIVSLAIKYGGHQKGEIVPANNKITVGIVDPDGNTLEFLQTLESNQESVLSEQEIKPILVEKTVQPIVHTETIQTIHHETIPAHNNLNKDAVETTNVPKQIKPINNENQEEPVLTKKVAESSLTSNKVIKPEIEKNNSTAKEKPNNMSTEREPSRKNENEQLNDDNGSLEILTGDEDFLQKKVPRTLPSNLSEKQIEQSINNNADKPINVANEEKDAEVSSETDQGLTPHEEEKILHISEKI